MGNSNIKQHIETAQKTGACQLSKVGFKEFPEELLQLTGNLRTLDLSENKIQILPPMIGSYSQLKHLHLGHNKIGFVPEEIGRLKKLETLNLEYNRLSSLPSSMRNLTNLRNLNLCGNQIRAFPVHLSGLKHLEYIDVSRNSITEIPEGVRGLQAIEINLNQNQVSRLSEGLVECPRLKVLRLEENCLEISAFTPSIMKHSSVALFAIEGNVFDMKAFHNLEGYEEYMERYTATKKKFN
ncbi:leucine-rich repeat-containing protein 57-like [Gigantopelta aegis]|uniref:leucine-rich repeat-containing protein 57-like n=1 Tax=Gigantopelta aegis TaxID=1735272 RepID=UPI001B88C756|nr:leucine-rich repeat-containing protein 57-like [Gigantopelta aegis]